MDSFCELMKTIKEMLFSAEMDSLLNVTVHKKGYRNFIKDDKMASESVHN